MIEFYPQIRHVHILAVILSGSLFALRGLDHTVTERLVWDGVRMLALLPGAALVGAVLAFLLRSTGAVLGVAVGYTIAVELILRQALPVWRKYRTAQNTSYRSCLRGRVLRRAASSISRTVSNCSRGTSLGKVCLAMSIASKITWRHMIRNRFPIIDGA